MDYEAEFRRLNQEVSKLNPDFINYAIKAYKAVWVWYEQRKVSLKGQPVSEKDLVWKFEEFQKTINCLVRLT